MDSFTGEHWVNYDPNLHTREGFNNMKIKTKDPVTGFIIEKTFPITYKSDLRVLFQVNKTRKTTDIWIDNSAAFSSYGVSLDMQPSNSELLSPATHLNSNITEDSGFRSALLELLKIDPEMTRTVIDMKEEDIKSHFTKHSKMFTPYTFINFVTGFVLTNQEFAKFVQPEPQCQNLKPCWVHNFIPRRL